jgi:4-amino-4-deoxy-L-arabinose transferase-like glycosyltransferase
MSVLWSYFWPCFAIGLVVGLLVGVFAFHRWPRKKRNLALGAGVILAFALTLIWHGPLGGADRFAAQVDRMARAGLIYYEVPNIEGKLHRGPLTRRLILTGIPATDFQRVELARLFSQLAGVSKAQWGRSPGGAPLMAEGAAVAFLGFLFGLLLAYLIELHRRHNAQWSW